MDKFQKFKGMCASTGENSECLYCLREQPVFLRPLNQSDIESVRRLRNENRQWFVYQGEITPQMQTLWYQDYIKKTDDCMFSIVQKKSGRWIGSVAIYNIQEKDKTGEFGRLMVDRDATDLKGVGLMATRAACEIAFSQMGLRKLYLEVFSDNPRAIRTYERAGFQYERTSELAGNRALLHMVCLNPKGEKLF